MSENRKLQILIDAKDNSQQALKGISSNLKNIETESRLFAASIAGIGLAISGFGLKSVKDPSRLAITRSLPLKNLFISSKR